jgi:hypothetical protein
MESFLKNFSQVAAPSFCDSIWTLRNQVKDYGNFVDKLKAKNFKVLRGLYKRNEEIKSSPSLKIYGCDEPLNIISDLVGLREDWKNLSDLEIIRSITNETSIQTLINNMVHSEKNEIQADLIFLLARSKKLKRPDLIKIERPEEDWGPKGKIGQIIDQIENDKVQYDCQTLYYNITSIFKINIDPQVKVPTLPSLDPKPAVVVDTRFEKIRKMIMEKEPDIRKLYSEVLSLSKEELQEMNLKKEDLQKHWDNLKGTKDEKYISGILSELGIVIEIQPSRKEVVIEENNIGLLKAEVEKGRMWDVLQAENFRALRSLYIESARRMSPMSLESLNFISKEIGLPVGWNFMTDSQVEEEIKKEEFVARCINFILISIKVFTIHSAFEGILEKTNKIRRFDKVKINHPEDWILEGKIFNLIKEEKVEQHTKELNMIKFGQIRLIFNIDARQKKDVVPPSKNVMIEVGGKPYLSYQVGHHGGFEGEYLEFWPGTDMIRIQGRYMNNKKHKTFTQRDKEGNLEYQIDFLDGKKNGNYEEYEKGIPVLFCQYKEDKLHGIFRRYTPKPHFTTYVDGVESSGFMDGMDIH